jgi:hypothetical protein
MRSSGNEEVSELYIHLESLYRKERRPNPWKDISSPGINAAT